MSGDNMRAAVFAGIREIAVVDKPIPTIERDDDAIVKVEMTSICGTDLHPYRGEKLGLDVGTTMAHEMVGTIVEVGPAVKKFKPGQRIVSAFTPSCNSCWFCEHDLTCRCEHELGARCYGWVSNGEGLQGLQAEFGRVALVDTSAVVIPDNVSSEKALLCADVLPTGWFCAESAGISELLQCQKEVSVAVIGCGPVGLAACAAALSLGASQVYAIDRIQDRLEVAQNLGAERIPEGEDPVKFLQSVTSNRGVDCVLEAVGSPGALRCAFDSVRMGGVISSVGMHHNDSFSFTPAEGYNKNITYKNGRSPARIYMETLLDRLSRKDSALEKAVQIISLKVSLHEEKAVINAYREFDEGKQMKVVITSQK